MSDKLFIYSVCVRSTVERDASFSENVGDAMSGIERRIDVLFYLIFLFISNNKLYFQKLFSSSTFINHSHKCKAQLCPRRLDKFQQNKIKHASPISLFAR